MSIRAGSFAALIAGGFAVERVLLCDLIIFRVSYQTPQLDGTYRLLQREKLLVDIGDRILQVEHRLTSPKKIISAQHENTTIVSCLLYSKNSYETLHCHFPSMKNSRNM